MVQLDSAERSTNLYVHKHLFIYLRYLVYFNLVWYYFSFHTFYLADLPRVSLKLGKTLNADNIKEGDDVYFECSVKAKPKAYKIEWKFNVSKYHTFRISSIDCEPLRLVLIISILYSIHIHRQNCNVYIR